LAASQVNRGYPFTGRKFDLIYRANVCVEIEIEIEIVPSRSPISDPDPDFDFDFDFFTRQAVHAEQVQPRRRGGREANNIIYFIFASRSSRPSR